MPNLKVVLNPVTSATRIPLIANGTIDLECGSTTNTRDRQKQVAFAYTTFVAGIKMLIGIDPKQDYKDKVAKVSMRAAS